MLVLYFIVYVKHWTAIPHWGGFPFSAMHWREIWKFITEPLAELSLVHFRPTAALGVDSAPAIGQTESPHNLLRTGLRLPADNCLLEASSPNKPDWRKYLFGDLILLTWSTGSQGTTYFMSPPVVNFTVTTFIEGCSRSDPGQPDAAAYDYIGRLSSSHKVVWNDDSALSLLECSCRL